MSDWTRTELRQALLDHLELTDPAHARWLQEHPQSTAMTAELTTDAYDLWLQVQATRRDPPTGGCEWTWMTSEEIRTTVIARTLEASELWADLDEHHPRTTTNTSTSASMSLPLLLSPPAGGPTRATSRRED
jgi:hypothetical protein